jgi:hypothetical protein
MSLLPGAPTGEVGDKAAAWLLRMAQAEDRLDVTANTGVVGDA